MSEIICPNCDHSNAPGSKFCNNCGTKLPPSTKILCPNCGKPNSRDLFYCDHCGTRLVQEKRPTEAKTDPSEQLGGGAKMFSLPARKPGQTGELDPNRVPDWLRTGETPDEGSDEESEDLSAEQEDQPQLSDLTPSSKGATGDLPEWLLDEEDPSTPLIETPKEITTDDFFELLNKTDEADEEETPDKKSLPEIEDLPSKPGSTGDLPEWLVTSEDDPKPVIETPKEITTDHFHDLVRAAQEGPEQEEEEVTSPPPEEANLPDWLAAALGPTGEEPPSGTDQPDKVDDQADEPPAFDQERPDWLAGIEEEAADAPAQDEFTASFPGDEDSQEEAVEPAAGEEEEPAVTAVDDLFEMEEEMEATSDDSFSSWLSGSDADDDIDIEDNLFGFGEAETETAAEEEDFFSSWLSGEGEAVEDEEEDSGLYEDQEEEEIVTGQLTSWLTELEDEEPETAAEEEKIVTGQLTSWLTELEDEEPETAVEMPPDAEEEKIVTGQLTSWLTELEDEEPETAVAEETPSPTEEEEAFPDWLAQMDVDDSDEEDFLASEGDTGKLIDDLFQDDEPDSDVTLDWLTDTVDAEQEAVEETGVSEADDFTFEEDEALEPGLPAADEEPDWLLELSSQGPEAFALEETAEKSAMEEPETVDSRQSPSTEESPPPQDVPAAESPELPELEEAPEHVEEDFVEELFSQEEPPEGELPDWITQLSSAGAEDIPSDELEELVRNEDLPPWLSSMRPGAGQSASSLPGIADEEDFPDSFQDIPEELADADLPQWLQIQNTAGTTSSDEPAGPDAETADAPGWMGGPEESSGEDLFLDDVEITTDQSSELNALLNELPPSHDPAEELVKTDIPDWVEALKPKTLTGEEPEPEPEAPVQESGPLAGIRGVIDIEPAITSSEAVLPSSGGFTVTPDQQQQADLLQQLAQSEERHAVVVGSEARGRISGWTRFLLVILLLVAILVGLQGPNLLQSQPPSAPAQMESALAVVDAVAGQPVLVAFEYTPAMAGELNAQAEWVVSRLAANNSPILTVSQYAAGTTVASATLQDRPAQDLGLITGDAIGLRLLGECLQDENACETIFGRPLETDTKQSLANVKLVIVITGKRDSLINWIEQVGTTSDTPLVAATTQALEPVAAPYLDRGQLQGTLSGLAATNLYQQELQESTDATSARQQQNAQVIVQLLVALLLGLGLIYGILKALIGRLKRQRRA